MIIFNTAQNAKKPHPAGPENTAIPQFEIKIPEISQEKWSNTPIPQTPNYVPLLMAGSTDNTMPCIWAPSVKFDTVPVGETSSF